MARRDRLARLTHPKRYGSPTVETLQLVVTAPPPNSIATGSLFSLTVAVENSQGQVDSSFTGTVTLDVSGGPAGSSLGGTITESASSGVATFPNLTLGTAGTYTITPASGGVIAASPAMITAVSSLPPPTPAAHDRQHRRETVENDHELYGRFQRTTRRDLGK